MTPADGPAPGRAGEPRGGRRSARTDPGTLTRTEAGPHERDGRQQAACRAIWQRLEALAVRLPTRLAVPRTALTRTRRRSGEPWRAERMADVARHAGADARYGRVSPRGW